jgi:hypothetical protein
MPPDSFWRNLSADFALWRSKTGFLLPKKRRKTNHLRPRRARIAYRVFGRPLKTHRKADLYPPDFPHFFLMKNF